MFGVPCLHALVHYLRKKDFITRVSKYDLYLVWAGVIFVSKKCTKIKQRMFWITIQQNLFKTLLYCRDALLFSLGLYLKSFKKICYFLQKSFIFLWYVHFVRRGIFSLVALYMRARDMEYISTNKDNICCIVQKWGIHSLAHFCWAKWEICSHCSFPLSDLSELLMVAHFSWAKWAIRSHGSFDLSEMRDSLTLLTKKEEMSKNEQFTNFFEFFFLNKPYVRHIKTRF